MGLGPTNPCYCVSNSHFNMNFIFFTTVVVTPPPSIHPPNPPLFAPQDAIRRKKYLSSFLEKYIEGDNSRQQSTKRKMVAESRCDVVIYNKQ